MLSRLVRLTSPALLLPFLLFVACSLSSSQTTPGLTTNYRFAEPNELTIVVNLLGAVARPGRYEISRSIDLINLLSLAGGTLDVANLDEIKIARAVKASSGVERKEIRVNVSDLTKVRESDLLLYHGDYVYVDRRGTVTLQEVLSYLTTAAVLTTAFVTVIHETNR